jgi:predicted Zn-dependent protease
LTSKLKGTPAALERYTQLKNSGRKDSGIDEDTFNYLGYMLLQDGQMQDAIAVLRRNVQEYPQSWNVYDSLGEAYMQAGQKDLVIANYERSVVLNPKNQNGIDKLKKLRKKNSRFGDQTVRLGGQTSPANLL